MSLSRLVLLSLCSLLTRGTSATHIPWKPRRVPATPLWVHSPYINWLMPSDNATGDWVWHVRNDKVGSMTALVRIDNVTYSILGPLHTACPTNDSTLAVPPLQQISPPIILPTRTVYSFTSQSVDINMTFASPKYIEDMDSYTPVALFTVEAISKDLQSHYVSVFFELTGQLVVDNDQNNVSWAEDDIQFPSPTVKSMHIYNPDGKPLREYSPFNPANYKGGQPTNHLDWGAAHLTVLNGTMWGGSSNIARSVFATTGGLPTSPSETFMPIPACRPVGGAVGICKCAQGGYGKNNDWPSLTATWDSTVSDKSISVANAILSYNDEISARYFGIDLQEYWRRNGKTHSDLLKSTVEDYSQILSNCSSYDEELVEEFLEAGGSDFAAVSALSYRQVLGDNSLLWFPGFGSNTTYAGAFLLVKGLGSSGDTGTIDDNYPASLLYLWRQPELLNALLRPINIFMLNLTYIQNSSWPYNMTWQHAFSIHYLGQYPIAELQCWGNNYKGSGPCEAMPLEMTADNLQMLAIAAITTGNYTTAKLFMKLLQNYADYLVANGLDPTLQLCSDDFEGPSAHNANLAAKSIIGIGAFSKLCSALGNNTCAQHYHQIASKYAANWSVLAAGGRGGAHTRNYGTPDSWSLKYNLLWDTILSTNLFTHNVFEKECNYYMSNNSTTRQQYGWYLDDRSETDDRHLTNAGWAEWAAAMCGDEAVADLYNRIRIFAETTPDRYSLTDYYNAVNARRILFEGRAQMGGFGATLMLHKIRQNQNKEIKIKEK
eukprot:m.346519 g.346519  ORF g.346519 m.346519 type:complete len:773 (+) comp29453_c0_seq1:52-2370(+)